MSPPEPQAPPSLFSQLNAFSWESGGGWPLVQFPCTTMHIELVQDLAEHKFWGVDGARVEATGRAPFVFTATIPFRNNIVPGKNERWGVLYPTAYRNFLRATADRATGKLVHPEVGEVLCKVRHISTVWDAHKRDGCDVQATWVETLPEDNVAHAFSNSRAAIAITAGANLDAHIRLDKKDYPQSHPEYAPDFESSMRDVAAIGDQTALLSQRAAGKIDQIKYRLDAVDDAATRVKNSPAQTVHDIITPDLSKNAIASLNWPVRQASNAMRDTLSDLRSKLLESGRAIVFYRVPRVCTFASLVASTGAALVDLMALNPAALGTPGVPAGTLIRYYDSARR